MTSSTGEETSRSSDYLQIALFPGRYRAPLAEWEASAELQMPTQGANSAGKSRATAEDLTGAEREKLGGAAVRVESPHDDPPARRTGGERSRLELVGGAQEWTLWVDDTEDEVRRALQGLERLARNEAKAAGKSSPADIKQFYLERLAKLLQEEERPYPAELVVPDRDDQASAPG